GGGGFRYYRLAPSLLEKDRWGNWVIHRDYNAAMLSEALCKLEGFTYAPSDAVYWRHGHSTERDFVYVTTASLTHEQLQQLSDEVGPERSLLVLCMAFWARAEYSNLTIKKIPKHVLSRCEWGRNDYSLCVENLPAGPHSFGQCSDQSEAARPGLSSPNAEDDMRMNSHLPTGPINFDEV
ncbi:MAG: site-specific DNA-methyltransferase, partial [Methylococcales bacterium]